MLRDDREPVRVVDVDPGASSPFAGDDALEASGEQRVDDPAAVVVGSSPEASISQNFACACTISGTSGAHVAGSCRPKRTKPDAGLVLGTARRTRRRDRSEELADMRAARARARRSDRGRSPTCRRADGVDERVGTARIAMLKSSTSATAGDPLTRSRSSSSAWSGGVVGRLRPLELGRKNDAGALRRGNHTLDRLHGDAEVEPDDGKPRPDATSTCASSASTHRSTVIARPGRRSRST